jgi:nucleotide-binding universal stress UspA family protein
MKKIVIPTDFGEHAEKAFVLATKIAQQASYEIQLLHVSSDVLPMETNFVFMDVPVNFISQKYEGLNEDLLGKLKAVAHLEVFEEVKISYSCLDVNFKNPIKEVLKYLNKKEHAMVVMGTSGSDIGRDSNAQVIARKAVIPVITTKGEVVSLENQKVLMPTDFKTVNRLFISGLNDIASWLSASVVYVYVNTQKHFKDSNWIEQEWAKFVEKYDIASPELMVFNDYHVVDGIRKAIAKVTPVMIAFPTHGLTGFDHLVNGSYTEQFINELDFPVYSYNMSNHYHPKRYKTPVETRGFTG